ncbi:MAG: hypothetical protein LBK76_11785 [Verrucomicrobiales bacterium]|jgi:hypothetical protein|nr:hypothetical protein [Verrucomicrobiales bacterium]
MLSKTLRKTASWKNADGARLLFPAADGEMFQALDGFFKTGSSSLAVEALTSEYLSPSSFPAPANSPAVKGNYFLHVLHELLVKKI